MASIISTGSRRLCSLLLMATALIGFASAVDVTICADFNTADMNKNISIYQTNGLCRDFCAAQSYVYAITQVNDCWCSSYAPAESVQVNTGKCNHICPGFPDEKCGADGLFSYIFIGGSLPSGTRGADGDETSPTSTDMKKKKMMTETNQNQPNIKSSSAPTSSSSSSSSTSSSEKTTSTSSSSTPPPSSTSLQTVTTNGIVKTVTYIPTQTSRPSSENQSGTKVEKSGLSTGAIVGIVVGVVGGVLGLAALAIFFYFRRKKMNNDDYQSDPSIRGSSSGVMGSGRPEMSRAPGSPGSTGNRSSNLQIDPRMDPFRQGLYARSGSHESVNTLHDDHDYSRRIQAPKVLRATNPDPDP